MEGSMKDYVYSQISNLHKLFGRILEDEKLQSTLLEMAEYTARMLHLNNKLIIAGNGGSAADAQHLAAEFISRLTINRPALHAIALTTDSSILTAIGNDYGFESVFRRQIEAVGHPGDIFLGISTSGESRNIIYALQQCRNMSIKTFGLTGGAGGQMEALCDYLIQVPSSVTQHIQEAHLSIEHIFCGLVERYYFGIELFQ
jgi:D-sedoheptulose 7-phosphate isomerase